VLSDPASCRGSFVLCVTRPGWGVVLVAESGGRMYGDALGGAMTEANGRVHSQSCTVCVWGIGIGVGEGWILGD
jgi:hypothetical protein